MPVKSYKPVTPSRRTMTGHSFDEITKTSPEKSLTSGKKRSSGRNSRGRITVRRRGGGHKRRYRDIDFKRDKYDMPAEVTAIEYDPNRSARIALLRYQDGEKRYILQPENLQIGDEISSGKNAPIKIGNALPLENIPLGTDVHNIEFFPKKASALSVYLTTGHFILAAKAKNVIIWQLLIALASACSGLLFCLFP